MGRLRGLASRVKRKITGQKSVGDSFGQSQDTAFARLDYNADAAFQLIGASLAAFVVLKIFGPAILNGEPISQFDPDGKGTSAGAVVAAELFFTFALAFVILNVATSKNTEGNNYFGLAIGFTVMAGAFTVGDISLGSFNPAVTTALCITGKLAWADSWMHYLPQILGAVLAAFTFKGLNPDDK